MNNTQQSTVQWKKEIHYSLCFFTWTFFWQNLQKWISFPFSLHAVFVLQLTVGWVCTSTFFAQVDSCSNKGPQERKKEGNKKLLCSGYFSEVWQGPQLDAELHIIFTAVCLSPKKNRTDRPWEYSYLFSLSPLSFLKLCSFMSVWLSAIKSQ